MKSSCRAYIRRPSKIAITVKSLMQMEGWDTTYARGSDTGSPSLEGFRFSRIPDRHDVAGARGDHVGRHGALGADRQGGGVFYRPNGAIHRWREPLGKIVEGCDAERLIWRPGRDVT